MEESLNFISTQKTGRNVPNKMHQSPSSAETSANFSVGERVWVNGTKSGVIQYLGPTRFAPGEWAGIVLDQPLGKNNGTVDGFQYFQCDPLHGLFAKTSKLVGEPTLSGGSKTSSSGKQFRLGDRVSIHTSSGPKTGYMRYLGPTDFAEGEWAGIELEEPNGKNDGTVNGKRYFSCRPLHGLFAPSYKLLAANQSQSTVASSEQQHITPKKAFTRSNSNISSISSVKKVNVPVQKLNRSNSSFGTKSAASSGLQGYKEKLADSEVAEPKLDLREQELKTLLEEKRKLESSLRMALAESEQGREALLHQIEEYKKELEDLHFRLEEESISKVDLIDERLAELQDKMFKKDELLLHMEALVDEHRKDYIIARTEVDDLKVQRMKLLEELKDHRAEKHFLENEVKLLKQTLEEERLVVESLQKEQNALKRAQNELHEETKQGRDWPEAQNQEIAIKEELIRSLECKVLRHEETIKTLTTHQQGNTRADLEKCYKLIQTEQTNMEKTTEALHQELQQQKIQAQQTLQAIREEMAELENRVEILQAERDALLREKDEATSEQEAQSQNEEKMTVLKGQLIQFQAQFMAHKEELVEKLHRSQQECQAVQELRGRSEELQTQLEVTSQKLSLMTQERDSLQLKVSELQANQQAFKGQIYNLQHQLTGLHSREKELATLCDNQKVSLVENVQLVSELKNQMADHKEALQLVLGEKKDLEKQVEVLHLAMEDCPRTKTDHQSLQSQIEFLNSVVVDMHRKNDQLKSQLELMDNSMEDSEYSQSRVPTRVFCDYCDRFDVHVTEECPSRNSLQSEEQHSRHHRPRGEVRPYCSQCETFGHWTSDCRETY